MLATASSVSRDGAPPGARVFDSSRLQPIVWPRQIVSRLASELKVGRVEVEPPLGNLRRTSPIRRPS